MSDPGQVGSPNTQFADMFAEDRERERFTAPPTQEDRLVATILNTIRRTNITVSPPAHVRPIVWSEPIDLSARVSVAAAVGAYATAVTYTVPEGRGARISAYGVAVQDAAYTYNGSILWRIRKNGRPIDALSDWGEQRGSLVSMRSTVIVLDEEDRVEFQVRRAVGAGAPQDVDMSLQGWTWIKRMGYEGTASSVTAF